MEERAEARQALHLLHAIRSGVPASLSSTSALQSDFRRLEQEWVAKANGQQGHGSSVARESKNTAPRRARTKPSAALKGQKRPRS